MEDWGDTGDWSGYKPLPAITSIKDQVSGIKELELQRNIEGLLGFLDAGYPVAARRAASKALGDIAPASAVPTLQELLEKEPDRHVRINIIKALGRLANDESITIVIQAFTDKEALVRVEAAEALSRYNSEIAFNALLEGVGSNKEYPVRQYSAYALGKMGDRRAFQALVKALKDKNSFVRSAAAAALGNLGDRRAVEALKRSRHTTAHVRGAECAECKAIDLALEHLDLLPDR